MYEIRFEVKLFDVNGSYMSDSEYDANIFNALLAVHQDINYFYQDSIIIRLIEKKKNINSSLKLK
ncbi:hypothetical protein [Lactococcus cremoris]